MPPTLCPVCGQARPPGALSPAELDSDLKLGGHQRRIFMRLAEAGRRGASVAQLIDAMYLDDPAGGSLSAVNGMRVAVCYLRRRLAPTAWRVETILAYGYRLQRRA